MTGEVKDFIKVKEINGFKIETGVGKNGRPFMFECRPKVKVGDYFNAAKSQLHFGATGTGGVNGTASAHNCELWLPNKSTTTGAFFALETNLNFQASTILPSNLNAPTCVTSFRIGGNQGAKDTWEDDTNQAVFHFSGFANENGHPIQFGGNTGTAVIAGHIAINVGGVITWIAILDKATAR